MEENDLTKIFVFICIALISICLSNIIKSFRIDDLEKRIDDLEQRNLEAHEYILNKIGG